MPSRRMPACFPLLLALLAALPVESTAGGKDTADLCRQAAEEAARKTGVPVQVLLALTLTETGWSGEGTLHPWPWALNEGGQGHWFASEEKALAYLADAVAAGVSNVDVGCFQLNYRWHGTAFASLDRMMDPHANALYAARLLARHAAEQGDWIAAAGAYHSATPAKAEAYLARFRPIYAALSGDPLPGDAPEEPRLNRFPLLMAGQTASAGSLVPLAASGRALFGGP